MAKKVALITLAVVILISTGCSSDKSEELLVNPSWEELKVFLWEDKTDQFPYTPEFTCEKFAKLVQNNAQKEGIRGAIVYIELGSPSNAGHALNAFETSDRGMVYIDCGGLLSEALFWQKSTESEPISYDTIINNFEVGRYYKPVSVFKPASTWGNMGKIVAIDNIEWKWKGW